MVSTRGELLGCGLRVGMTVYSESGRPDGLALVTAPAVDGTCRQQLLSGGGSHRLPDRAEAAGGALDGGVDAQPIALHGGPLVVEAVVLGAQVQALVLQQADVPAHLVLGGFEGVVQPVDV